jgi:hypothetical protein
MNITRLLGLSLILLTFNSLAAIKVEPIIIDHFAGQSSREDLTVKNIGKTKEFVLITPKVVEHPGTKNEKLKVITSVQNLKNYGLYVTPRRLLIPQGESRTVRVGFLNSAKLKKDRIFRVSVEPKQAFKVVKDKANNQMGLNFILGYAVLVMDRPPNAEPIVEVKRNAKMVTFKNTGNSNALLTGLKQCIEKTCTPLSTAHRLYAGTTWEYALPKAEPVTYSQFFGMKKTTNTSN